MRGYNRGGILRSFRTEVGARQGCPLSPTLFNLFIEDIDETWAKRNIGGTVIGGKKIFCMKFADDLLLTADNTEGLQEMFDRLAKYCDKNKLTVNTKKTKIMVFRRGGKLGKKMNGFTKVTR